jgi:flagellar biosynthetic protein FliR
MIGGDVTNWLLVFVRAGALLAVFPLFSARHVPVQVRLALGALTAFLVAPSVPPAGVERLALVPLTLLLAQELAVGLLLGFMARMAFFALDLAGNMIGQVMGLNTASLLSPFSENRADLPGLILFYLGAVLFLTLDLHHWLLLAFQKSYAVLPVGGAAMSAPLLQEVTAATAGIFVVAIQMAAPMLALSFLLALVFAVLGRAVPQMNVFAESFSIRTLAGLATFGLTLNLVAQHLVNCLRRLPEDVLRVAQLLGR